MLRSTRAILIGVGGLVVVAGLAAAGLLLFGRPSLSFAHSHTALADMQIGGVDTHLADVHVALGAKPVAFSTVSGRLMPSTKLPAGTTVKVTGTVTAPGWLAWLVGRSATSSASIRTPRAHLDSSLAVTTATSSRRASTTSDHVAVRFTRPVQIVAYRTDNPDVTAQITRVQPPSATVDLPVPSGSAGGILEVSGVARSWETVPKANQAVTWFTQTKDGTPAVVANPPPGAALTTSNSAIHLVFSTTVAHALGRSLPKFSPAVKGTWSESSSHELVFTPSGFGFGPGTTVTVSFDHHLVVVGNAAVSTTASNDSSGTASGSTSSAVSSYSFTVDPGSVLRLDQILAQLKYLPLQFTPAPGTAAPTTLATEEKTIYAPLAGTFSWRYGDIPPTLAAQWTPGQPTVMVKGALMAFEGVEGTYNYTLDDETVAQIADAATWKALLEAALANKVNPNPYSYVYVSKNLPETLTLWQDGQVVLTSLTNTGIPQDPTEDGTYPIYLRYVEHTMSGTNPNGTHYDDLVHWINYFNGGDAVHGFVRASYGFPQSLGCAELPVATAAEVFPHLALGDLVTIAN